MNQAEALYHLEQVVEVYADINPDIREAIDVLSAALEREQRMAELLEVIVSSRLRTR